MQRVDAVIGLIRPLYLSPGIEELIRCEQRTIFVVHTITNHHESIISKQVRNIPTIAHSQLRIGIHNSGIFLHGTLKLQYHHWQTVYIDNTIRDTLLRAFYLQLVNNLEDILVNILKVYHLNEQIRLRRIFTLDGKALCHQPVRLDILLIQRCTTICCQFCNHTLHLQRCNTLLAVPVHQIQLQVITQQHLRQFLMNRLAALVAVALLFKQLHDGHFQTMFVEV